MSCNAFCNLGERFSCVSGTAVDFLERICSQIPDFQGGYLMDEAKGRTSADGRVLLTTAEDKNYETQVEIRTGNGNVAGLSCIIMKRLMPESFPMERDSIFTGMRSTRRNFPIALGNISLPDCTIAVTVCPSR